MDFCWNTPGFIPNLWGWLARSLSWNESSNGSGNVALRPRQRSQRSYCHFRQAGHSNSLLRVVFKISLKQKELISSLRLHYRIEIYRNTTPIQSRKWTKIQWGQYFETNKTNDLLQKSRAFAIVEKRCLPARPNNVKIGLKHSIAGNRMKKWAYITHQNFTKKLEEKTVPHFLEIICVLIKISQIWKDKTRSFHSLELVEVYSYF